MNTLQIVAYRFDTRMGTFWVRLAPDDRWIAKFEQEDLGNYASPRLAADDLAG